MSGISGSVLGGGDSYGSIEEQNASQLGSMTSNVENMPGA